MNDMPFGMAVVDCRGVILHRNSRLSEAFSLDANGESPNIRSLLPALPSGEWDALSLGRTLQWEGRIDLSGGVCDVRIASRPLPETEAHLVTVIDITHERERESLLAAALEARREVSQLQDYYRTILDNAPDGVFVTDADGMVRFWNRRMEEYFGVPGDNIVGKCLFDEIHCWQAHTAAFQRVLDAGDPVQIERVSRSNHLGASVVESISFLPLSCNGTLDGVLGRVSNATQQADLERQLIKSERMAAVGELAAGVAHNFNNILAGIGGDAQLLRMIAEEDHLGESVINSADMIYRETMRGGRIAHDLLSFARGQEPCLSEVDVSTIVAEAVRLSRTYPQASDVEFRPQVPSGLPRVSADPNQLHQIFFNIILNAIQAMPHGGSLTVDSRIVSREDGRPRMEIRFEDTGIGIPEELLGKIFDPFFTNRRSGSMGTGLGLSVSQSMVRGMDGDIFVESEVGRGTTMVVVLPIVERRRRPRIGEKPKKRILIADDEPTIRRTLSAFLSRSGYHVISARDGVETMGILDDSEAEFGLLIVDLLMPRVGGAEVVRRMKTARPNLPVIVLTGVAGADDLQQVEALGVPTVLRKPVNFDELLKTVETLAGPAEIPVLAVSN
ncbi:MAG TPA: ATP-binding protein [Armatimonadota bacterium]